MNGEEFFLPQMLIGMSHAMTLGCIFDIQMGAYIGKNGKECRLCSQLLFAIAQCKVAKKCNHVQ